MFGTLGFSELIIILVIVLIIFGAGRLPQIGEGVGKALKRFKKEVNEVPPPAEEQDTTAALPKPQAQPMDATASATPAEGTPQPAQATTQQPYKPGPEATPGTLAAQVYTGFQPETVQPPQNPQPAVTPAASATYQEQHLPPTMEQRATGTVPRAMAAQYPPMPQSAMPKPGGKRPSAVVNKEAVARVQAQRAAMQQKAAKSAGAPEDMQSLGEGLGSALRTFRDATADVRNSIDPEMRTIQAELDAAQKEVEQTIEVAKQPPLPKEPPSTT